MVVMMRPSRRVPLSTDRSNQHHANRTSRNDAPGMPARTQSAKHNFPMRNPSDATRSILLDPSHRAAYCSMQEPRSLLQTSRRVMYPLTYTNGRLAWKNGRIPLHQPVCA